MDIKFIFDDASLQVGVNEVLEQLNITISEAGAVVYVKKTGRGLKVYGVESEYHIEYERKCDFFRALALLCHSLAENIDVSINETASFEKLTHMVDCSRNAVIKVEAIKRLIRNLALMGFNSLMLYTEDTYEVTGYRYFGYMRGRYTKEEIKECEAYAENFGIELIPCIQTLAHLRSALKWGVFAHHKETDDILFVGEEKTYQLIEAMIKSLSEMYTSRSINIGMDEAHMIGLGKYLDKHGFVNRFDIMTQHLKRVIEICKKYGFEPMMWSDMFFRLATVGEYYDTSVQINQAVIDEIPKEVSLVYWDYYSHDSVHYDKMLTIHKNFKNNLVFAGGAWSWHGFAPCNNYSIAATKAALEMCKKHEIKQVIATSWGDDGNECSVFPVLPSLVVYAEGCYSENTSYDKVAERFKAFVGVAYEDFILLETINRLPDMNEDQMTDINYRNPSKYLLFNDVLMGMFDRNVFKDKFKESFKDSAVQLRDAEKRAKGYGYIFDTLASLAELLTIKCEVGVNLKEFYDRKDIKGLKNILNSELIPMLEKLEVFYQAFKRQWYMDNKVFGFDIQDIRIGGLEKRIKTAIETIEAYVSGRVDQIEELEVERLNFYGNDSDDEMICHNVTVNQHLLISSPNCF